jgi:hypothetical protein
MQHRYINPDIGRETISWFRIRISNPVVKWTNDVQGIQKGLSTRLLGKNQDTETSRIREVYN